MNADTFVEECRREWKRLGVPAEIAGEMAAELRSDLADAAADHVPPEELLGAGAFDAPAFAASWASERGVVPATPPRRRRPVLPALVAAAIVLAAAALAVALFAGRSTHQARPATSPIASGGAIVVLDPKSGAVRRLVLQETSLVRHRLKLAHP
ncbi:MAG TPA: hypothetical protein VHC67_13565 [Gaiellaceae bacterium]|nr:hypothetical protein [Gaiellaceae bacterium]